MRRPWFWCALGLGSALASGAPALAQFFQQRPQTRPATVPDVQYITALPDKSSAAAESSGTPARRHYPSPPDPSRPPVRWHYLQQASVPPAAPPPSTNENPGQGRNARPDRDGDGQHHRHRHGGIGWPVWGGYPLIWVPGYTPAFGPYGLGYPSAVQQGFGVVPPLAAPAPVDPPADDPAPPSRPKVRVTSAEWKAKAGRYLGYGDTNFGKQSYLAAAERYRTAAQMAPDLAEPFLRQGFALVAMGQYDSAAKAFRRGLRIRSDWSNSPFRLDQIYGNDQIAKTAHQERLAKAVEANPLDADLLLALGMEIFFDGQPERAELFFARVAQLGGNDDKLLDDFLPRPGPADAAQPGAAPKAGQKIVF